MLGSTLLSLTPVLAYLPKNGVETNGFLGLGKSPQYLPWAIFMYWPQIGAATSPPAAPAPSVRRSVAWPTQTEVASCGV